jgi:hypothetical protein
MFIVQEELEEQEKAEFASHCMMEETKALFIKFRNRQG